MGGRWWHAVARGARLGLAAVAVVAATSCSYSPSFADGTLVCGSAGECPKGYSCGGDNTCHKTSGGASSPTLDAFVGSWTFSSGTLIASCSDGSNFNGPLDSTDFILIDRGGAGLLLEYYCDTGWSMSVPSGKSTATAVGGQTCRQQTTDTSGVVTNYTWSNKSMTFSTTDGLAATVTGNIAGPFSDSTNVMGTCNVTFNGALTKD